MSNQIHDIQNLLDRAAHAVLHLRPDPLGAPAAPPGEGVFEVRAAGRRLHIVTPPPSLERGLRARNTCGEVQARFALSLAAIPDGFAPFPGRRPPPLRLDWSRPQRILLEGTLALEADDQAAVDHDCRTLGAGRTWPRPDGSLGLAAVGSVLDGKGVLGRHQGIYALSGRLRLDGDFRLLAVVRLVDPRKKLLTDRALPAPRADDAPGGDVTYLALRTFADPLRTRMISAPAGGQGFEAPELSTAIATDFHVSGAGARARQEIGQVVGEHNLKIYYFPSPQNPGSALSPIPFFDQEVFTVEVGDRRLGSFRGDVVEGRSQQCPIPGTGPDLAPQLFGGFGRLADGEGCFAGSSGSIINVGVGTVNPHLTSILYLLELDDPDGRYRLP